MANEAVVAEMKQWCVDNYEKGADTMVECWGTTDYEALLARYPTVEEAWSGLRSLASIYSERQADARYYRENF